jgi:LuxR family maltose regulon positive regulatory protein
MSAHADPRSISEEFTLIETKVHAPLLREGLVPRSRLVESLRAGSHCTLTLVCAPAGYGKTTLLGEWCLAEQGSKPFAWVSLDAYDDYSLTRFWTYIIEALRVVEPELGANSLAALKAGASLMETVMPLLVNELASLPQEVVLVLDDYHHVRNEECQETMRFLIDKVPPTLDLVISTRAEPPLRLGLLRARGELSEIRIEKLGFTCEEASELLNEAMAFDLSPTNIERLVKRTEGWVAGLYLAGLSLRDKADTYAFVDSFAGDNRNIADYLIEEVINTQPEEVKTFLCRSSILDRFSGSLCDAVVGRQGSAELLEHLERLDLFVVPLDEMREWYRYHQLFRDMLGLKLKHTEPDIVSVLHSRASAWFLDHGAVDQAIRHTIAAGEIAEAAELIARHWLSYVDAGQADSVSEWLSSLPEGSVTSDPRLCLVKAWLLVLAGKKEEAKQYLSLAEVSDDTGPLPDGASSIESSVALIRALYVFDEAGRPCEAARRAVELEIDESSPWRAVACMFLGYCLYWSGEFSEARGYLEDAARLAEDSEQNSVIINALALLSFIEEQWGNLDRAEALARRAVETVEGNMLSHVQQSWSAFVARGKVLAKRGEPDRAEGDLERGLKLQRLAGGHPELASTLLALAPVRRALGRREEERSCIDEACEIIEGCVDPGILSSLLESAQRNLTRTLRRYPKLSEELTEREFSVLELLSADLTQRQIGSELYLSFNTVKSHTKAIYRKLGVSSRAEMVEQARLRALIR